ncbi:MAG: tetratricopeptide repeat protein, partial [Myxococcota bacterium]
AIREGAIRPAPAGKRVPVRIRRALIRGLSPRPEDRHASMAELLAALRSSPARRRLIALVAVGVVAGAATSRIASGTPIPCAGAREQLSGAWDDGQRQAAQAGLLATEHGFAEGAWQRAQARLDTYADEWVSMHGDACEATAVRGEQSAELLDMRMGCLQSATRDLAAVADVLADADAEVVEHIDRLLERLPPISRCADIDFLRAEVPPPHPSEVEQVAAIDEALARARAAKAAGRVGPALEHAIEAETLAHEVEYPPIRTRSALTHGAMLEAAGRWDEAEAAYRKALGMATHARQWRLLGRTAVALMRLVGTHEGADRTAEALRYREIAENASADPLQRADVHQAMAAILSARGDFRGAGRESTAALRLFEAERSPDSEAVIAARTNVGIDLESQGRYDEALEIHEETAALVAATRRPDDPMAARAGAVLARVYLRLGRFEEAVAELFKQLEAAVPVVGGEHPMVVAMRWDLASALSRLNRLSEAEAQLRKAIAVTERGSGSRDHAFANVLATLGIILRKQGRLEEARTEQERALALLVELLGPDHVDVAFSRGNLAATLDALGKPGDAEKQLRQALRVISASMGAEHDAVGTTRINLALSLQAQGKAAAAEEEARQALVIRERAVGPNNPALLTIRNVLGVALHNQGQLDAAHEQLTAAVAIADAHPHDPRGWDARASLAELALDRGHPDEARRHAEAALTHQGPETPAASRGAARWALARAIRQDDPSRAKSLASEALRAFEDSGSRHEPVADAIRAWLLEL